VAPTTRSIVASVRPSVESTDSTALPMFLPKKLLLVPRLTNDFLFYYCLSLLYFRRVLLFSISSGDRDRTDYLNIILWLHTLQEVPIHRILYYCLGAVRLIHRYGRWQQSVIKITIPSRQLLKYLKRKQMLTRRTRWAFNIVEDHNI